MSLLTHPVRLWHRLAPTTRDSIKAGAYTALWSFIAMFGLTATGWLGDVTRWAQDWAQTGTPGTFPSLSVLAAGAVSAAASVLSGFVGTLVRLAQAKTSIVPGHGPEYRKA